MEATDPRQRTGNRPRTDGDRLRTLRYCRGWTISDVVHQLKSRGRAIHENHLRNIEAGHKNASAPLLFELADILGTTVEELMVLGTQGSQK